MREELEPLLKEFEQNAYDHLETLRGLEGYNDKEIEVWEMHIELLNFK